MSEEGKFSRPQQSDLEAFEASAEMVAAGERVLEELSGVVMPCLVVAMIFQAMMEADTRSQCERPQIEYRQIVAEMN